VRALVERASRRNTIVPGDLHSYRTTTESELSLLIRHPDGSEGATQIEQVASVASWQRSGAFTQHIVGYRSRLSGLNISALALIKQSWLVPVLYGNRLGLFLGRDTTHAARRAIARDTAVRVVHPFAADRDSVYHFAGGDTALTIRIRDRTIPIAVVHVTPRAQLRRRTLLFRGDIYLDLDRAEIVRMRGAFVAVEPHPGVLTALRGMVYQGVALVDLTNRQVNDRFWLPDEQRIEGQVATSFMGDTRSVFRAVTRFGRYAINDTTAATGAAIAAGNAPAFTPVAPLGAETPGITTHAAEDQTADTTPSSDTLRVLPHRLTVAPGDSLTGFSGWHATIGELTTSVPREAFTDVVPPAWIRRGPPRVQLATQSFGQLVHFDRVEGLYTGVGGRLTFNDAVPGLELWGHAGWAWTEQTARGGIDARLQRGSWRTGFRAERVLANTNDFTTEFTTAPFLEALIVQDEFDYVDRRSAALYADHYWLSPTGVGLVLRLEGGVADDQGDRARLTRSVIAPSFFMGDSLFRPNRNVLAGTYGYAATTLEMHPGIDAGFVGEGLGLRIRNVVAGGQLTWDRAEVRLVAERTWGAFTGLARVDGGIVVGTVIPPQQLFEIGINEGLLAYDYKQFGGDRAAIWKGEMRYALPMWRGPLRIGGFFLPSPAPAVALGFQSGWAEAGTHAGRVALLGLGVRVNPATNVPVLTPDGNTIPVSQPTHGVRTSINLLVRFFGGAIGVGVAHSLDRGATLQGVVRIGGGI
jgi:hypothetical protein